MLASLEANAFAERSAALPLIRRLFAEYGRPHARRYAVAVGFMVVAAACTALAAYILGEVINQSFLYSNYNALLMLSAATVVIFIIKGFSTYAHAVILARIGNRIVAECQRRLFAKLLYENIGFFADRHSSEFAARLNAGATAASQVLSLITTAFGRDLMTLIGLVIVMAYQDPIMSLFGLIVVPPTLLVLRKLTRRARTVAHTQIAGGARVLETLQETIQGIRVVKAFTLEDEMRRRADKNIAEVEAASNKMARVANRSSPLMESLGGFAVALAFLYAGYRVIETGAEPGAFASFLAAFLLAYEPAKRLARLNIDLNSALAGVRVLFDLIDNPASEAAGGPARALEVSGARVELRDVDFAYRAEEPVLRGLSFVAERGRITALVGPSGGGKTTVLSLILRLYEPGRGQVLIDGQDIATVARASVRRQIAYVGQDVFLFRGTIGDNIRFGRPDASEQAIVAAATAAFAHEFITGFPAGYDTPVGERGLQLSGGQRQRIAVARALIKDAPLILLDEATAALDSESEQKVQQAIARLCEGRTTIVIAHRLSTVMHADMIHVIEDGRVVESGTHEVLLRRGGRYASFHGLQLQQQDAPAAEADIRAALGGA